MALSASPNKQFTEPLTTSTLKPVLTVSCGIVSCFLKFAAICQSLPALGPNTTCLPRKASLLHFSSLMDKTDCNTFFPLSRWSIFNYLLSHAAKALTVVMSPGVSLLKWDYFSTWRLASLNIWETDILGRWKLNNLYIWLISFGLLTYFSTSSSSSMFCQFIHLCWGFALQPFLHDRLTQSVTHFRCAKPQGSPLYTCSTTSLLYNWVLTAVMVFSEMSPKLLPYPCCMKPCILMTLAGPWLFSINVRSIFKCTV